MPDNKGTDNLRVGKNIAYWRKQRGLTQIELSKEIRVSKNYVAAIEEGRKQPKVKILVLIAKSLDVELGLLLKKTGAS